MKNARSEKPADSRTAPSKARRLVDELLRGASPAPKAGSSVRLAKPIGPIAAPAW
ncbi:hypothetical protein AB0J83_31735 [Actinoplanes sp. NPDC049596]|uniref:hypothetical protein n=1 Tax=unclassified Actinoplanes TaxID=2626549 RepID=UPI003440A16F